MRNIPDKLYREYQNTKFVLSNFFFSFENRSVYEIMWKNIGEPGRQQMTIWHLHIACLLPKATNTHTHVV